LSCQYIVELVLRCKKGMTTQSSANLRRRNEVLERELAQVREDRNHERKERLSMRYVALEKDKALKKAEAVIQLLKERGVDFVYKERMNRFR